MTANVLVALIEELIDLKVQQYAETTLRVPPDVAKILREKREADRRRIEQIRAELVKILE